MIQPDDVAALEEIRIIQICGIEINLPPGLILDGDIDFLESCLLFFVSVDLPCNTWTWSYDWHYFNGVNRVGRVLLGAASVWEVD